VIYIPIVTFYLPDDYYIKLALIAKEKGVGVTTLIRQILIEALVEEASEIKKESSEEDLLSELTNIRSPRERIKVVGERCGIRCKYYEEVHLPSETISRCAKFNVRVELVLKKLGGPLCPYFIER